MQNKYKDVSTQRKLIADVRMTFHFDISLEIPTI